MNEQDREISARAFGHLEAEVAALAKSVEAQTVALAAMSERMEAMNKTLAEARGGWRMLLLIGGAAATAGSFLTAAVTWAISHIQFKGMP